MTLVSTTTFILSSFTIVGQIIIFTLVVLFFVSQGKHLKYFSQKAILFSFIVALMATLVSLFYSEIAHYAPCQLCWFQRIFMYPQVILLGIALWKKDKIITVYNSIALSTIGGLIAGYHYLLQVGVASALPCGAVGYSAACSQRFVLNFGYITIPMMAFTAFALIVTMMIVTKKVEKI